MELFQQNGNLIPQHEWEQLIDNLRQQVKPSTKEEVKQTLIEAVKKRIPKQKFGIFLSGGLDSSLLALIAKQLKADFICYSVGTDENKPDIIYAKKIAQDLGFNLKIKVGKLTESDLIKVIRLLPKVDPVNLGVGLVILKSVELGQEDDITIFLGGLGAEEIFAGYQRHLNAQNVNEECWLGLKKMWVNDLQREYALGKALNVNVLTPFMDKQLIVKAMGIDGNRKIVEGERKVILRHIAEELGLPKYCAWRKKQAAQYGSGFDKAIEKMAKKLGKTRFVASLST